MDNQNRTAIITGSSRGIGRAIAIRFAHEGCNIVVNYSGNRAEAKKTAESVRELGARAIICKADVGNETEVAAMFDTAESEFGGIDVVVNSAGLRVNAPVVDYDLDLLDRVHRTNIRGTFIVCQQAVRRVRSGGSITNISSSALLRHAPTSCVYIMSKAAIEAMSLVLARELPGRNINVNSVGPGPTSTELFFDDKSEEMVRQLADATPFGRIGEPEEIAEIVAFLAGPGHWINGQNIPANGGLN